MKALGKATKTWQRWRPRAGCPQPGDDGLVDLDELRAWALAAGLLERTQDDGRRSVVEALAADVATEPGSLKVLPGGDSAAPGVTVRLEPQGHGGALKRTAAVPDVLRELTDDDRKALEALIAGDAEKLIDLAARVDAGLLKRLAAMGRTRRELADAERRELENRARRAELVPLDEMRRFWIAQIGVVKAAFSAAPGKLAQALEGLDYDGRYSLLERELQDVLDAFAVEVPA